MVNIGIYIYIYLYIFRVMESQYPPIDELGIFSSERRTADIVARKLSIVRSGAILTFCRKIQLQNNCRLFFPDLLLYDPIILIHLTIPLANSRHKANLEKKP